MTDIPKITYLDDARTESDLKNHFFGPITSVLSEMLGGAPVSRLPLSSGVAIPFAANHTIDTEAGASSDDLESLDASNHSEGRIITISCADNSRSVVVKHGSGNAGQVLLHGYEDLTLNDTRDRLFLQLIGSNWEELFRAGPSFMSEPADSDILKANELETLATAYYEIYVDIPADTVDFTASCKFKKTLTTAWTLPDSIPGGQGQWIFHVYPAGNVLSIPVSYAVIGDDPDVNATYIKIVYDYDGTTRTLSICNVGV